MTFWVNTTPFHGISSNMYVYGDGGGEDNWRGLFAWGFSQVGTMEGSAGYCEFSRGLVTQSGRGNGWVLELFGQDCLIW